jgi:hypothetical protein
MLFLIKKYKNKYLYITGITSLFSFFKFLQWYLTLSQPKIQDKILGIYCISVWISTILFWKNPIKNSLIHKVDAMIAKSCCIYYIAYTLSQKNLENIYIWSYVVCINGMIFTFYLSNRASTKEWCSSDHIYYHGLLHLFAYGLSIHAYL